MPLVSFGTIATLAAVCMHVGNACYQDCSITFNAKIQKLTGIRDSATLTMKSCEAMSEQMVCLEGKRMTCDATSLQYVNNILNFIRPDFERTCAVSLASKTDANGTLVRTPTSQQLQQCSTRANECYTTFNDTYGPEVVQPQQNIVVICGSLDNYTMCLEDLMPECGQFMTKAIASIRNMQMQYSYVCSGASSPQAVTECVNDTMDCYSNFNTTFVPAVSSYKLADMCKSIDVYSQCLNTVHQRKDCQRYTQQALAGIFTLKRQYSVYCGRDGGQQAQECVSHFQECYGRFNLTYFPAMHTGNMDGICSAVTNYSSCVEPLFSACGMHIPQALASARILKEQFAQQCDKEYQTLVACQPLQQCLRSFGNGFIPSRASSSANLCKSLSSYFPCVEESLVKCNIRANDTSVDFSQLGSLTGAYCHNLLSNGVLNTCREFVSCTSGIVLVNSPDPSAVFDASTWCSYMDMSLSCVERARNTPHCGLGNDDTIKGHLTTQRALKRSICKPPGHSEHAGSQGNGGSGTGGTGAATAPAVASLVLAALLSLVL